MAAEPGSVGAQLAQIFAETGLTWGQISDLIGASSGDYVRKVAAGAKPGRNLAGNVSELMRTGSVSAPAPRRRTSAGTPARVRARPAAPGERPSRVPVVRGRFSAPPRSLFRTPSGRMGWSQPVNAPRSEGKGREDARQAILAAVRSAAQGGRRVQFTVAGPDGVHRPIGAKGGYNASAVLRGMHAEGDDPFSWLDDQGEHYGIDAAGIVGVVVSVI